MISGMGAARTTLAIVMLMLACGQARADEAVQWLVAPGDDVAAWQAASALTWPDGGVVVVAWEGAWPPVPEDAPVGAIAWFEGELPEGVVVARSMGGEERRVPLALRGMAPDEGRRAALLVLSSIHLPVGVTDSGWRPDEPTAPPVPDELQESAPLAVLEEPPLSSGLRATLAVGLSYRRGLDQVSTAPSVRGGFVLGSAVRVVGDLSFDVAGRTRVGGRSVWVHGASLVAALEVRPAHRRAVFPLWLGLGGGMLWAARVDGGGRLATAGAPVLRAGAGAEWVAANGMHLGLRFTVGAELVHDASPILVRAEFDGVVWSRTMAPVTVGLQLVWDLGDPRPEPGTGLRARRKP